ncbi:MAG: hypothetical protein ACRC8Y_14585 [Chroococcales cyanobacterium]
MQDLSNSDLRGDNDSKSLLRTKKENDSKSLLRTEEGTTASRY